MERADPGHRATATDLSTSVEKARHPITTAEVVHVLQRLDDLSMRIEALEQKLAASTDGTDRAGDHAARNTTDTHTTDTHKETK